MRRLSPNRTAGLRGRRAPTTRAGDAGVRSAGILVCTNCRAAHDGAHWSWSVPAPDATPVLCPACVRVRDGVPLHTIVFRGVPPVEAADLSALLRRVGAVESRRHPLERLMYVAESPGAIEAGTTGIHLARRILAAALRTFRRRFAEQHADGRSELSWLATLVP